MDYTNGYRDKGNFKKETIAIITEKVFKLDIFQIIEYE